MNKKSILNAVASIAMLAGVVTVANAQENISVSALVQVPVSINVEQDMDFGTLVPSKSGGKVYLDLYGGRSCILGVLCVGEGEHSTGIVRLNGPIGVSYNVILPEGYIRLSNANGDLLSISPASLNPSGTFDGDDKFFYIAGSMNIASNQPAGVYSGTYEVNIDLN